MHTHALVILMFPKLRIKTTCILVPGKQQNCYAEAVNNSRKLTKGSSSTSAQVQALFLP